VSEKNFALLNDPALHRLLALTSLQVDEEMTRAYPGKQGGEVEVRESGGASYLLRLEDVVNATALDVLERVRAAAESVVGAVRTREIEACIDALDRSDDVGHLGMLLGGMPLGA
jgi:hypothetical protein